MKNPLSAIAILALSCAPVYAGGLTEPEDEVVYVDDRMGRSNAAWIIPLIAIIAIAATSGGGKKEDEPKTTKPKCLGGSDC